jgi:hypothetical protein
MMVDLFGRLDRIHCWTSFRFEMARIYPPDPMIPAVGAWGILIHSAMVPLVHLL